MSEPDSDPDPDRQSSPTTDEAPEPASQGSSVAASKRPRRAGAKKRRRNQSEQQTQRRPLDAQGRERPRFLLDFPDDPELEALSQAYERGDFAFIRKQAHTLARSAKDPAVRDAILELRRRIDPDPLAKYLLLLSIGLLLFLILYAYLIHGH
jgi:hypothetical protein